jgi:murein hydrolase activator
VQNSGSKISILICMLLVFCSTPFALYSYAATPHEEYKKIQKQIKTHKEKLEKARKREDSILTEIEDMNKQFKVVESDLKKYKNKLANTETRIAKVESEINQNKSNIERYREWIKKKLRAIHRYGYQSDVVMLFMGTDDISQIMRRTKYLQYITVYEHKILSNYKNNIENLSQQEKELIALKKELIKNREKVQDEEEVLLGKKKHKEVLLASVKKEETSYARMLRELKDASKKILDIIRESEEADRQKGKDEPYSSSKNFTNLKGKLPWPLEGKVAIPYGSQKDPQFNTLYSEAERIYNQTLIHLLNRYIQGRLFLQSGLRDTGNL